MRVLASTIGREGISGQRSFSWCLFWRFHGRTGRHFVTWVRDAMTTKCAMAGKLEYELVESVGGSEPKQPFHIELVDAS